MDSNINKIQIEILVKSNDRNKAIKVAKEVMKMFEDKVKAQELKELDVLNVRVNATAVDKKNI